MNKLKTKQTIKCKYRKSIPTVQETTRNTNTRIKELKTIFFFFALFDGGKKLEKIVHVLL